MIVQKGAGKNHEDVIIGITATSGATLPAGKVDNEDDALRKGKLPKAEAVRQVTVQSGVTRKCQQQQDGGNANGKHRDEALWGDGDKARKDGSILGADPFKV